MATQAHCAYCFESLAAHFERRQPLSLAQVEELWGQHYATTDAGGEDGEGHDSASDDEVGEGGAETTHAQPASAKPAALSRLLNGAASATSSSSSLPSTNTTASSVHSPKGGSGTATPASSASSSSRASLFQTPGERRDRPSKHPLFVTWNTVSKSGYKSLRGCIGTFEAQELEQGLRSYAMTSAFEDVRFKPIPASLLPSLSCHVTLLTNFSTPTTEPLDWVLGKHGIRISFTLHARRYGSTYLPDVAKEQGWTKEETLISLMRKAGWSGSSSSWLKTWRDGKGELVRYEGKQIGLLYPQWREWRDWVDAEGKALN